jgi:hypothetical protein
MTGIMCGPDDSLIYALRPSMGFGVRDRELPPLDRLASRGGSSFHPGGLLNVLGERLQTLS